MRLHAVDAVAAEADLTLVARLHAGDAVEAASVLDLAGRVIGGLSGNSTP